MGRVFLVGFMGAGKSTLGKLMARHWTCSFLDLDQEIECYENRSISTIFAEDGESYFRGLETQHLRRVAAEREGVIALGGGTFVSEANQAIVRSSGLSIFLDVPFETLWQRVGRDPKRPLSVSHEAMKRLYLERLPQYRCADVLWRPELPLQGSPRKLAMELIDLVEAENSQLFR